MADNPILWADYPDPDVIRVNDTYYMVSTTMHFMPGCVLLRSYDLLHWETAGHVYAALDDTPQQRLEDGHIYGKGMWAASLRFHEGVFHIVFVANDTHRTYHYTACSIEGPWEKSHIEGFYHDCSLLFDAGRVYIAYGNRDIYLTELRADLSGPRPGGLHKCILRDEGDVRLGYEGSHLYKIGGRYYLCLIHWPNTGHGRRTQAIFSADSLSGPWTGGDVLDDDLGFHNMGVAQGGLVDTPDGRWYAMLFQDHGAVGRIPVLVPVRWENGLPRLGPVPAQLELPSLRPGYRYAPLVGSDDFRGPGGLGAQWEWNHQPQPALVRRDRERGVLWITTGRCAPDVEHAPNTLTQRAFGPHCRVSAEVDASRLRPGDTAGLCALQGCFGQIALRRDADGLRLCVETREADGSCRERAGLPWRRPRARLRMVFRFEDMRDEVAFFYQDGERWVQLGEPHHLVYRLDHFTGCRIGLFVFSAVQPGGSAGFADFTYTLD